MLRIGFIAALVFVPLTASAEDDSVTVDQLRFMSQDDLNATYAQAQPGPLPDGESDGTAVFFPGSLLNVPTQMLAALVWQGKVFATDQGILVNKVFGFRAIKAKVYNGRSLFDSKQSIIIDYSQTSFLAHAIRDEIRLVAPGIYLGRAYYRSLFGDFMVINFILDFN